MVFHPRGYQFLTPSPARPLSAHRRRGRPRVRHRLGEGAVQGQAEGQASAQGAQRGAAPQGDWAPGNRAGIDGPFIDGLHIKNGDFPWLC